jgi:hypothetical protein
MIFLSDIKITKEVQSERKHKLNRQLDKIAESLKGEITIYDTQFRLPDYNKLSDSNIDVFSKKFNSHTLDSLFLRVTIDSINIEKDLESNLAHFYINIENPKLSKLEMALGMSLGVNYSLQYLSAFLFTTDLQYADENLSIIKEQLLQRYDKGSFYLYFNSIKWEGDTKKMLKVINADIAYTLFTTAYSKMLSSIKSQIEYLEGNITDKSIFFDTVLVPFNSRYYKVKINFNEVISFTLVSRELEEIEVKVIDSITLQKLFKSALHRNYKIVSYAN